MKIICVDNFNRESVAEKLIAENVKESWGRHIVKLLNDEEHDDSPNFFMLVEDDHKLWGGMKEFI